MTWHDRPLREITEKLVSNTQAGLTATEAGRRLAQYGENTIPRTASGSWFNLVMRQLKSPLVYILIIGAVLTALLHEWIDMVVILSAVVINIFVGFFQEFRSNNILESLRKAVRTVAIVIRDGNLMEIDARFVIPGDIIILKQGWQVPADARVIEVHDLTTDESILTGESEFIAKDTTDILDTRTPLGDRRNMVHMGTTVESGNGAAIVVATGKDSAFGDIAVTTESIIDEPTPLQYRMKKLGTRISLFVAAASIAIFAIGISENHTVEEMLPTAIAVAVAAIPEGLPAAISIVLAISAERILKEKGVVKRLVAAETLGSASVICTDKTGTLTEGKMQIEKMVTEGDSARMLPALALANEAIIERKGGETAVRGETTDCAKMEKFLDEGGDLDALLVRFPRTAFLPFNSKTKYIASIHSDGPSTARIYVSGSPESLLRLSSHAASKNSDVPLDKKQSRMFIATYEQLAAKGYRVIAFAQKNIDAYTRDITDGSILKEKYANGFTLLGFVALRDPIRKDVHESIKTARKAGIRTIMLTGDHILTAQAIGGELGFSTAPGTAIEGTAIEDMTDEELADVVVRTEIYARVSPSHKMRIVSALQHHGNVVAMTGDGINDAPAIKSADIGIAVDSGTDIAKSASDLILLDNGFSVIVSAIKEGRIAFDNIRKVTVFLLAGSFTEVILILSSLILRVPLPVTAAQILWTNLVADTFPNIALSFEPGEDDVMRRLPSKKREPILDTESKVIIYIVGILTDIVLMTVFLVLFKTSSFEIERIRTIIFSTLGLSTFFYAFSVKSLRRSLFRINIFNNTKLLWASLAAIGTMIAAIYLPALNIILKTVPLRVSDWAIVLTLGIIEIVAIEIAKWWFIRKSLTLQME